MKRSKERYKEHVPNTPEESLKEEEQTQSDEKNSNSGPAQEHAGIAGTQEEILAPDYAVFGKSKPRPSLKF